MGVAFAGAATLGAREFVKSYHPGSTRGSDHTVCYYPWVVAAPKGGVILPLMGGRRIMIVRKLVHMVKCGAE